MAMSDEHKAALAAGRREARAIKVYLAAVSAPKRRGRPVTKASLERRIAELDKKIQSADDPLRRVDFIQKRMDLGSDLAALEEPADLGSLEKGFITCAASYSKRKGISYGAWREAGVPASVLKKAAIKRG